MKITATPVYHPVHAIDRLARRIRDQALSPRTVDRFERELEAELEAVATSERAVESEARRDALERAVRRVWGAPL
jgi:hypothetical protein